LKVRYYSRKLCVRRCGAALHAHVNIDASKLAQQTINATAAPATPRVIHALVNVALKVPALVAAKQTDADSDFAALNAALDTRKD
jgi:hypothetical protein